MKQSMILLHGLFGQLSNWDSVVNAFGKNYEIYIPSLPIHEAPKSDPIYFIVSFVEEYINTRSLDNIVLVGNSLGGHVAILYAARNPGKVKTLVLTGSSGLYENNHVGNYPRRNSEVYIRERVAFTFFDPAIATDELVANVLGITRNTSKCIGVLRVAKSAQRHYVADLLPDITAPTLLIWGREDQITPVHVVAEFQAGIPDSTAVVIESCGHAPMMEKPSEFNNILFNYLSNRMN